MQQIVFIDDENPSQEMRFHLNTKNKLFIEIGNRDELIMSSYITLNKEDFEVFISELIKIKEGIE